MKNIRRHRGTLKIIKVLPNSRAGNPRYLCTVDGWTFKTKPDTTNAIKAHNLCGKTVEVTIGTYYGQATLNTIRQI